MKRKITKLLKLIQALNKDKCYHCPYNPKNQHTKFEEEQRKHEEEEIQKSQKGIL